jgi:hypothetical protein
MAASTPGRTGYGPYLARYLWMVLATLGAAVVIVLLLIPLGTFGPPDRAEIAAELQPVEIVEVVGTGRISIVPTRRSPSGSSPRSRRGRTVCRFRCSR